VENLKNIVSPVLLCVTLLVSIFAILQVTILPADFLVSFGYDKDSSIAPFILVDNNPQALRAFSTLRGPNTLGSFLILPLILAVALLFIKKWRVLSAATLILGGAALVLTGARSAWIGFFVAVICLLALELPAQKLTKIIKWGTLPAVIILTIFIWVSTTIPALRLAIFHSSPGDPTLLEGSTENHWMATKNGAQDVINNPIGSGVGSAGPASFYNEQIKLAENYFIQIAQEVGLVGLALFIAIYILVFRRLWRARNDLWPRVLLASFVGLTVVNIFLHGWADDPTAMIWWGLAGLFAWPGVRGRIR
jgi:O-antigen ligase